MKTARTACRTFKGINKNLHQELLSERSQNISVFRQVKEDVLKFLLNLYLNFSDLVQDGI